MSTRPGRLAPVPQHFHSIREHDLNWYDARGNAFWLPGLTSERRSQVAAHEMSHFFLHVSTPYGWFLDELASKEDHQVSKYCHDTFRRNGGRRILVPVYPVAARVRQNDPIVSPYAFADLCEQHVHPWAFSRYLQNLLEGADLPEVTNATHADALEALAAIEAYEDAQSLPATFLDTYLADAPNRRAVNTMTWPDGSTFPLGARHIFEGLAKQLERETRLSERDFKGGNRAQYWALWAFMAKEFGGAIGSERDYRRLTDTFLALCDLALFVPAGRLYRQLRQPWTTWDDLQPGWRFTAGVIEAKKLGLIGSLEQDLLSYQEQISSAWGWPAPRRFLEIGAATVDPSPEAQRHAEACRIRLASPFAFLDIEREVQQRGAEEVLDDARTPVEQFFIKHLPLTYRPDHDAMLVRSFTGTTSEPLHLIIRWFFARFNDWVMLRGVFTYEDLLPQRLQADKLFSNIASLDDFVSMLRELPPIFRPDGFQDVAELS